MAGTVAHSSRDTNPCGISHQSQDSKHLPRSTNRIQRQHRLTVLFGVRKNQNKHSNSR